MSTLSNFSVDMTNDMITKKNINISIMNRIESREDKQKINRYVKQWWEKQNKTKTLNGKIFLFDVDTVCLLAIRILTYTLTCYLSIPL